MRQRLITLVLGLVLLSGLTPACGGSSGGDGGGGGDPPSFTVTDFSPGVLPSEVASDVSVLGTEFAPVGGTATVRLTAQTGTPFEGGTSATMEFPANIDSDTELTGSSSACGVSGSVDATVTVVLPDNSEATSDGAIATIAGPQLTAFSPQPCLCLMPGRIRITGTDLGEAGGTPTLRLTATTGTPFADGTSASVDLLLTLSSETTGHTDTPYLMGRTAIEATVEYVCASGAVATLSGTVSLVPRIVLDPTAAEPGGNWGYGVDVEGDTAIVGAPFDNEDGNAAGAACIFHFDGDTWSEQQTLRPADGTLDSYFGWSVAISGDTAVIAAPRNDHAVANAGAAYVFVRSGTTWTEQQKLVASDASTDAWFADSVDVDGDTAALGARIADGPGAVYVFTRSGTTWTQQQKVVAADPQAGDQLGESVALEGDTVVAGATRDDDLGLSSGSAYVFVRSAGTWTQQAKLVASDGVAEDWFGGAVAISGETVVVGAQQWISARPGAAYVFTRSGTTWTQQQKLTASDGEDYDYCGYAVGLSGDRILVGAYAVRTTGGKAGPRAGAAYLFTRTGTTWAEDLKMMLPDHEQYDDFGFAVALRGDRAIVGAVGDDDEGRAWIH